MKTLKIARAGIFKSTFSIPEVSKYAQQIQSTEQISQRCTNNMICFHRLGTWKITAHYDNDEENVACTEFKVQQFGELNQIAYVWVFFSQRNDSDSAFFLSFFNFYTLQFCPALK